MSAPDGSAGSRSRPAPVEFLPCAGVQDLIAQKENELDALRAELETALQEAQLAEERLKYRPGFQVFDAEFEDALLALLALGKPDIGLSTQRGPAGQGLRPTLYGQGRGPESNGTDPSEAERQRRAVPPVPVDEALLEPPTQPTVPAPAALRPSSSPAPRTTVVKRPGAVASDPEAAEARRNASNHVPSSPKAPAEQYGELLTDPTVLASRTQRARLDDVLREQPDPLPASGWLAKIPPRLLIQVGVAVVIISLILLKLG